MDIETLKNFIVIAESDSISQAARKLYVAQSALSNRLKALEKECGARLIERDYHNFRLTESGRILYERAIKIAELADAAISDAHTADTGEAGTLNIAVTPSLATGILRDVLKVFRAKYPRRQREDLRGRDAFPSFARRRRSVRHSAGAHPVHGQRGLRNARGGL